MIEAGGIMLPDFGSYFKQSNQYSMVLAQSTQIDQWNRMENREINSPTCGQLIYDKELRIYSGEKTVSSISGAEKTWTAKCKERNKNIL